MRYAAPVRQKLAGVRWAKAFLSAQLRASVFQVHEIQTALATMQEQLSGKTCAQSGRGNPGTRFRIGNSDWVEKAVSAAKQGVPIYTDYYKELPPRRRFRAGVWAVVAHLRLLSLGRFSVNQTVTKVCQESVPLLPRGSVRMDNEMMLAVAEVADRVGPGSTREEAEAVVKLLDTVQKR